MPRKSTSSNCVHKRTGYRLCHWQSSSNTFKSDGNTTKTDAKKEKQEDAEYEALAIAWLSLERQPAPPRKNPLGSSPDTSNAVMNNGDCGKEVTNSEKLLENTTKPKACLADPNEGTSPNDKPPKEIFTNLMTTLNETPKVLNMVQELVSTLAESLQGSAVRVYKFFPNIVEDLLEIIFNRQELGTAFIAIRKAGRRSCKFVFEVAATGNCMHLSKNQENTKYLGNTQNLFKIYGIPDYQVVQHVLFIPIFNDRGVTTFVLEIWWAKCFSKNDEAVSSAIAKWGSIAINYYSSIMASEISN